jgi:WbqC-like protein family
MRRTTTVAVMQPYFFPYIGYFQLIAASDIFVFHDDVQYIKSGWVNRNQILKEGRRCWITFPVLKAPHQCRINQRSYQGDHKIRSRLLRSIETAYRKAPRFREIYPLLLDIMNFEDTNVAAFNRNLNRKILEYLGVRTPFVQSSQLAKDDSLKGQDRVIEICRRLGASQYLNPIGGRNLYQADRFSSADLQLRFLEPQMRSACDPALSPPLSIIDSLMRSSDEAVAAALNDYRLIDPRRAAAIGRGSSALRYPERRATE